MYVVVSTHCVKITSEDDKSDEGHNETYRYQTEPSQDITQEISYKYSR